MPQGCLEVRTETQGLQALGRNGWMDIRGFAFWTRPRGGGMVLVIEPIHSRGRIGRCCIELDEKAAGELHTFIETAFPRPGKSGRGITTAPSSPGGQGP
ncbi:MAG: hypothetical protein NT031_05760 [Planctomycetota bacterium]|nr:hypothetical protein [Planctomycetota bacterium]